jgi:hypothetical protein
MGVKAKPETTREGGLPNPSPGRDFLRRLSMRSVTSDSQERMENLPYSPAPGSHTEPAKELRNVRFEDHAAGVPDETTSKTSHRHSTPWTEKTLLSLGMFQRCSRHILCFPLMCVQMVEEFEDTRVYLY